MCFLGGWKIPQRIRKYLFGRKVMECMVWTLYSFYGNRMRVMWFEDALRNSTRKEIRIPG
jgi:hypothetical protein